MRKILSTALIIIGLLVASYPLTSQMYYWYWNNKLLESFDETLELQVQTTRYTEADYLALQAAFEQENIEFEDYEATNPGYLSALEAETSAEEQAQAQAAVLEAAAAVAAAAAEPAPTVLGRITIPKIKVKMAILEGASQLNLSKGSAHVTGTSYFGEVGNIGIAGHRGYSYGVMFNRLNELEKGDVIEVTANKKVYTYKVYKLHYVLPDDMTVLYRSKTEEVLTLITCETATDPTHRLIVHAIREP